MQTAFKHTLPIAGAMVVCMLILGTASASAQNLGEVARRNRAQKNQAPPTRVHVYTNEDLQRPQILVPEDRARIEANRENPATTPLPSAAASGAPDSGTQAAPRDFSRPADLPLGDVARYYRMLKELREEQRHAKEKVLPGNSVLASPKLTVPEAIPALRPKQRPQPPPRHELFSTRETPAVETTGVRVRRGDSLWKLASQYLGRGAEWREIFAVNPELENPNFIRAGQWIRLPQQAPSDGVRQARVQAGDSLWKLAQVHLGSGAAWTCLAQANPSISDVNLIQPGQVLNIPSHCAAQAGPSPIHRASN